MPAGDVFRNGGCTAFGLAPPCILGGGGGGGGCFGPSPTGDVLVLIVIFARSLLQCSDVGSLRQKIHNNMIKSLNDIQRTCGMIYCYGKKILRSVGNKYGT